MSCTLDEAAGKREEVSVMRNRGVRWSGTEGQDKVLIGALEVNQEAREGAWQNFGVMGTSCWSTIACPGQSHSQSGTQSSIT